MVNNNFISILPGEYSGYKIKFQSTTIGQLPKLEMAIDRAKSLLQTYKTNKIVIFNDKNEVTKEILV